MTALAYHILMHDKVRFAITVLSLGVAIVVVVYDLGTFFGTVTDSVSLIDHAQGQL